MPQEKVDGVRGVRADVLRHGEGNGRGARDRPGRCALPHSLSPYSPARDLDRRPTLPGSPGGAPDARSAESSDTAAMSSVSGLGGCSRSALLLQESLVEKSDDPALVLARPSLGAADVASLRNLPDVLGLAGRFVEVLAELLAALPAGCVDEVDRAGCDALDHVVQVRWGRIVREHRGGGRDPTPDRNRQPLFVPGRLGRFAHGPNPRTL